MLEFKTLLSKLQHKKLAIHTRKKGSTSGKYLTKRSGASIEFNDYRIYQLGDDIRQIDWNVYGRTKKHYIKTFLDEHMYEVGMILDYSNSMQVSKEKWNLAKMIAACISFVTLNGEDQLQYVLPKNNRLYVRKAKGKRFSYQTFEQIYQTNEQLTNQLFFEQCVVAMPKTPQMVFVISDFLEPIDYLEKLVRQMTNYYQYIYFIQVMDEKELNPTYEGDVSLQDSETTRELSISMNKELIDNYETRLAHHNKSLELLVHKHGGNYLLCGTDKDPYELILKDFVRQEIFV